MPTDKHLVFVHLLNDYSGSPMVLSHILNGLESGCTIDLFVSNASKDGILSNIQGLNYHLFYYRWSVNPIARLWYFSLSQVDLFFKTLKYCNKKNATIYVNTLLPFGAALAGWISRKKIIYHVHEAFIAPKALNFFLKSVVKITASKAIYVSQYLYNAAKIKQPESIIIPNALPVNFCKTADEWLLKNKKNNQSFNVLMLCSLKKYKGVDEFVLIAKLLPGLAFTMVVNDSQKAIDEYFNNAILPTNLHIFSMQKDVHTFYQQATVVVNLTKSDMRVETFGMTILEGMYYHLPVIVPEIGGIAELVEENVNGFKCPASEINSICSHLNLLQTRKDLYNSMATAARKKAEQYTYKNFITAIKGVIE